MIAGGIFEKRKKLDVRSKSGRRVRDAVHTSSTRGCLVKWLGSVQEPCYHCPKACTSCQSGQVVVRPLLGIVKENSPKFSIRHLLDAMSAID